MWQTWIMGKLDADRQVVQAAESSTRIEMGMKANGLNDYCPHRIICLNNSSVIYGAVSKDIGIVTLLEDMCYGAGFEISRVHAIPI